MGEFQPTTLRAAARDDGGHIHFDIAHLVRNTVNHSRSSGASEAAKQPNLLSDLTEVG